MLIAVEHLTNWPIAVATKHSTTDVVIEFVLEEIINRFSPPRTIVSDNATCFTATGIQPLMREYGITWKTVMAYAPMSNGKAERMVGTLKHGMARIVSSEGIA